MPLGDDAAPGDGAQQEAQYHAAAPDDGEAEAQHPATGEKVPLISFMLHEHSVIGLLYPDNYVAPPVTPCCCCCIYTNALTRRRRLFIFFFVLALSVGLSAQVSLGQHNAMWAFCVMALVVLPFTCHLKSNLATYSEWLQSMWLGPCLGVRLEELLLLGGMAFGIYHLLDEDYNYEEVLKAMWAALYVWGGALVSELICLPFKYYFCKKCCCCCVPETYVIQETA